MGHRTEALRGCLCFLPMSLACTAVLGSHGAHGSYKELYALSIFLIRDDSESEDLNYNSTWHNEYLTTPFRSYGCSNLPYERQVPVVFTITKWRFPQRKIVPLEKVVGMLL